MQSIASYAGRLLSHVETLYRPGERALAIELVEALGCAIGDTGFTGGGTETFLAAHPEAADRNMQNNVFYFSEMTAEHAALEDRLAVLSQQDAALGASVAQYHDKAGSVPFGIAHFAIRYQSAASVEAVLQQLQGVSPGLGTRLRVKVYRPHDEGAASDQTIQAFVHQDVVVSGSFLMGQVIELQYQQQSGDAA